MMGHGLVVFTLLVDVHQVLMRRVRWCTQKYRRKECDNTKATKPTTIIYKTLRKVRQKKRKNDS